MPTDYEQLRAQNLHAYGHETRHLELFAGLYDDRTHFLFELLQNAEDAGATAVAFNLATTGLEVRHDGRLFTPDDVAGICGVGDGTKADDLTKIGRFGIGFKSVYVYTATPEIHSGDEHFVVEHYVRPRATNPLPDLAPGATCFRFPFNHASLDAGTAYAEIEAKLRHLRPRVLLFLRNIKQLTWSIEGVPQQTYSRAHDGNRVTVSRVDRRIDDDGIDEDWLVYSRRLQHAELLPPEAEQYVQLAFRVKQVKGHLVVEPLAPSPLVVFFETQKPTYLGMLAQGPYRTTPARDNIPQDDPWNAFLIDQTADLLADSLLALRSDGLLTPAALEAMPHRPKDFPKDSMFRPLLDRFRTCVIEQQVLPRFGGGYLRASEALLARGRGIREALTVDELGPALGVDDHVGWIDETITTDRTTDLYRFLQEQCGVAELTPLALADRIDLEFLEHRSDEWLIRFYGFLRLHAGLITQAQRRQGPLATRPLFRLEDGTHQSLYDDHGHVTVFLPGASESSLPTIRRSLLTPETRLFFRDLGLSEPDPVAELVTYVLPRYRDGRLLRPDEVGTARADNHRIFAALDAATGKRRAELLATLTRTPFLLGTLASGHRTAAPSTLYRRTAQLETYFDGCPAISFVDESIAGRTRELVELDVATTVRARKRKPDRYGYVSLRSNPGNHARGLDEFDPEFTLDGLEHALDHPSSARARVIWELLRAHRRDLRGTVEDSRNRSYSPSQRTDTLSRAGQLAAQARWLPDANGSFVRPNELSMDDLPPDFPRDEQLATVLGMVPSGIRAFSEQVGVSADIIRGLAAYPDLQDELAALIEQRERSAAASQAGSPLDDGSPASFAEAISTGLTRAARSNRTPVNTDGDDTSVNNPTRRRERVAAQISEAKATPPTEPQFTLATRTVWGKKDNAVKAFLLEQYGGLCQICGAGFSKRNGDPYAEAIYLVSSRRMTWAQRPGNVLCLCPTCAAKFQHGTVDAHDFVHQVSELKLSGEGGTVPLELGVVLCGEPRTIRYTERHLLDLQALLNS